MRYFEDKIFSLKFEIDRLEKELREIQMQNINNCMESFLEKELKEKIRFKKWDLQSNEQIFSNYG